MEIRSQVSMVFHLDKCIGCHTCTIACKNIWTDRKGTEYMYWNNVETKPGTGYPTRWEDQTKYRGGWVVDGKRQKRLRLRLQGKWGTLTNIFHNPYLPTLDDYFEPWTYDYQNLIDAPVATTSRRRARSRSLRASPWTPSRRARTGTTTWAGRRSSRTTIRTSTAPPSRKCARSTRSTVPCLLPAAHLQPLPQSGLRCGVPAGCDLQARRGRRCAGQPGAMPRLANVRSGCPYKKTYFNWSTGKAEKCILCYPRLETGSRRRASTLASAYPLYRPGPLRCGRHRRGGRGAAKNRVQAQRNMIMDPFDPEVIAAAKANGIPDSKIDAAQKSPVYQFVNEWGLALPLHPEFDAADALLCAAARPVLAKVENGVYDNVATESRLGPLMSRSSARASRSAIWRACCPAATRTSSATSTKLVAVRVYMRSKKVKDIPEDEVERALAEGTTTPAEVEAIYRLTSMPTFEERFVVPPMERETAVESPSPLLDPVSQNHPIHKGAVGSGFHIDPPRGP